MIQCSIAIWHIASILSRSVGKGNDSACSLSLYSEPFVVFHQSLYGNPIDNTLESSITQWLKQFEWQQLNRLDFIFKGINNYTKKWIDVYYFARISKAIVRVNWWLNITWWSRKWNTKVGKKKNGYHLSNINSFSLRYGN
jgi:hypothetical protein